MSYGAVPPKQGGRSRSSWERSEGTHSAPVRGGWGSQWCPACGQAMVVTRDIPWPLGLLSYLQPWGKERGAPHSLTSVPRSQQLPLILGFMSRR